MVVPLIYGHEFHSAGLTSMSMCGPGEGTDRWRIDWIFHPGAGAPTKAGLGAGSSALMQEDWVAYEPAVSSHRPRFPSCAPTNKTPRTRNRQMIKCTRRQEKQVDGLTGIHGAT
jgi:hypothetical protein